MLWSVSIGIRAQVQTLSPKLQQHQCGMRAVKTYVLRLEAYPYYEI